MPASCRSMLWLWLALIALVTWAYWPGLSGGFEFDDDPNIVENLELTSATLTPDELWYATLSGISGPLGRPVAMFSFAVQVALTGLNPFPMKIVNLLIHGLTGITLYLLASALLRSLRGLPTSSFPVPIVAWTIAVLWLLHPINVTAVSYIVQRMTSLSALFTALAVWIYVTERNRQQLNAGRWYAWVGVAAFGLLAVLSKETGALLPVYLLVVEVFVFRFQAQRRIERLLVSMLHATFAVGAGLLMIYILWQHPDVALGGYQRRQFSLTERLLTEPRALVWYLRMILVPDLSQLTLYHDGFAISRSLLSPPTTLLSMLMLVILVILGWLSKARHPWFGFGLFWFLGGHALESTILPLELVFEHRNYLPAFGIIFACITGLERIVAGMARAKRRLVGAMILASFVMLAWATHIRTYVWSDAPGAALLDARHHPESPRANIAAGAMYARYANSVTDNSEKDRFTRLAEEYFLRAAVLVPDSAYAVMARLLMYHEQGKAPPPELPSELQRRLSGGRIDAGTDDGLRAFTECKVKGVCTFSDDYYLAVMDAAFSNANILDIYASNILRFMARFYAEQHEDYDTAILLTKRAMELRPRQFWIWFELIDHLTRGGYLVTALNELALLEREDLPGRYRTGVARWREDLQLALKEVAPVRSE